MQGRTGSTGTQWMGRALAAGVAFAICAAPGRADTPLRVTLQLRQVSVQEATTQLARELGAPVRIEGTRKALLSADVTDVPGRAALDAVADAVNGRWQRVYVLSGQGKGGGPGRLPSGRLLTLSIENASLSTAALMVAKAAGARWEMEGVPEKSVSVTADSEAVETVLDRIATAAGITWRAEYVLTVAEPAAKSEVQPASGRQGGALPGGVGRRGSPGAGRGGLTSRGPGTGEPPREGRRPLSAQWAPREPSADRALCNPGFYQYIFTLPQKKRAPFIQQLAEELRSNRENLPPAQVAPVFAQMRFERTLRLRTIVSLIHSLPPAHQKELKPIVDAIPQGVQTGMEPGGVGFSPQP